MIGKKICFWAMAAIIFICSASDSLWAMTNEEFLNFCAGKASPETYESYSDLGNPSISEALKANPNLDVNFQGSGGETPLMLVAANQQYFSYNVDSMMRDLLAVGAKINHQDKAGYTALTTAVATEAWASTVYLLLESGADVKLRDKAGFTALEFAATSIKNPEILGLLLNAAQVSGGLGQAQRAQLVELAQKNPNAQVLALLEPWIKLPPQPEAWQPLFTALPSDAALVEEIKMMALNILGQIQRLPEERQQNLFYNYLIWQTRLANDLDGLKFLGRSEAEAWRQTYALFHQSIKDDDGLSRDKPLAEPAKLLVQVNYEQKKDSSEDLSDAPPNRPWQPIFALTENEILIVERSDVLVGYELATGKELWSNPFPGTQYTAFGPLILSLNAVQDDSLAQITVIDANSGLMLWQAYNPEYWLTDRNRQVLTIFAADMLARFDLTKYGQAGWITVNHLDREDTSEAAKQFLSRQGIALADYFETFPAQSDEGYEYKDKLLKNGLVGFYTENPYLDHESLKYAFGPGKNLEAAKSFARDTYGFNQFSLWGGNNNELVFFDRHTGRVYPLAPVKGRALQAGDLKTIQVEYPQEAADHFLTAFSPSGALLGLSDKTGSLHFFSATDNGRWLGSLDGQTQLRALKTTIKDLSFKGILNDVDQQKPIIQLNPNQRDAAPIMARIDLAKGSVDVLPQPSSGETVLITAFALSAANRAAVGLEDGRLWLLDMVSGQRRQAGLNSVAAWAALSYSADGTFLTLAAEDGLVAVMDRDLKVIWQQATGVKGITDLAVDKNGKRVWALISAEDYSSPSKIALLSEGSRPKVINLPYDRDSLHITGLRYDQSNDQASLLALYHNWSDDKPKPPKGISNLPLADVQATLRLFSGSPQAEEMRFDENVFSAYSGSPLLGLSNDGQKMILEGGYEYTQAFNPHYSFDFSLNRTLRLEPGPIDSSCVWSAGFSDDDRLVALGEEGRRIGSRFLIYDLQSGSALSAMVDGTKHPLGVKNIAFLHKNPRRLLTVGGEGSLRLWDLAGPAPVNILTWVFFKNGNQAVMARDSRFDTPNLDQLEGVHWVLDKKPGRTLALASLMKSYFQPRLAEYVLNDKKLPPLPSVDTLNLNQHGVRRVDIKPEPDAPDKVAVTVEVYLRGDDPHHPAQELKLFRDGQLVGKYTGDNNGLFDLPDGKRQVTFHNIALPQNKNQVMFKAWAFNEDGVRSKYFDRPYDYKPVTKPEPKLHLVSVGVNSFDNPAWDLKLAVNDAKGYAEILPAKLSNIKADVQLLASGDGLTKPNKANLKAALQKLAEGGSSPDDVVVLAIASHGLTDDRDNQFYILPADIPGQDKKITPELLAHSISTDELSDWLTKVDAAEIVMILDTCQSGAALGGESFKPGPMGDKGLGQLAYDKSMLVLTATNENNAAMELDNLGHGLLSFALLVDGLKEGKIGKGDFTFKDWLAYGQKQTAELYAKIAKGESIGGTRGKVKVDKTADNANPPLGQEPYLFDFGGVGKGAIRLQVK